MPLTASAPFAINRAQPPDPRRGLVFCASLALHATMLLGIGLLARPALRDSPSPAFEVVLDTRSAEIASTAPPDLVSTAPAPLTAEAAPLPTLATAPPRLDPATAPAPETAAPALAAETAPPPPPASLALPPPLASVELQAAPFESAPSNPAPRRPAPRTPVIERAARQPAPPPPRATQWSGSSAPVEPASMPAVPGIAAAPVHAPAPAIISSQWEGALASWIRSRTRYPEGARRLGQQGAVTVSFTVGHDGQVLEAHIAQRSGSDMLDQAALDMFHAARVPAFPSEMPQAQVTISVPVRYRLEQ